MADSNMIELLAGTNVLIKRGNPFKQRGAPSQLFALMATS